MSDVAAFVRNGSATSRAISRCSSARSPIRASAAANYERLEFLGDRVLGLSSPRWLYELYPDRARRQSVAPLNVLVARETCAEVGRELGVPELVRLGKQARDDGAAKATTSSATWSKR